MNQRQFRMMTLINSKNVSCRRTYSFLRIKKMIMPLGKVSNHRYKSKQIAQQDLNPPDI